GLHAEVLVKPHEIAVDELEDARRSERRHLVRIEVRDLALPREDQRSAALGLPRRSLGLARRGGGRARPKDDHQRKDRRAGQAELTSHGTPSLATGRNLPTHGPRSAVRAFRYRSAGAIFASGAICPRSVPNGWRWRFR